MYSTFSYKLESNRIWLLFFQEPFDAEEFVERLAWRTIAETKNDGEEDFNPSLLHDSFVQAIKSVIAINVFGGFYLILLTFQRFNAITGTTTKEMWTIGINSSRRRSCLFWKCQ